LSAAYALAVSPMGAVFELTQPTSASNRLATTVPWTNTRLVIAADFYTWDYLNSPPNVFTPSLKFT
jgi:hypothetical protein